jgi:DnaK suppressor protein
MIIALADWTGSKKGGRRMRRNELQPFRSLLLKKLHALEHRHGLGEVPGLGGGNSDTLDQANGELEKNLFFDLHERESRAIREVYQALGKIAEGTFGICEDCGERISQRRLRANPSATLCLECQKMKEREERVNIPNGRGLRIFLEA